MAAREKADPVMEATLLVAEQVGALMEFWGFKRVLGRIWTVLYLSERPLTAAEIGKRLHISVSAVSVGLTELRRWGVVQEAIALGAAPRAGRAQTWRAETDVWAMVTNVIRQRELPMVRRFEAVLREAEEALHDVPQTPHTRHARQAMKALLGLAATGRMLLDSLLTTARFNAEPLRKFPAG